MPQHPNVYNSYSHDPRNDWLSCPYPENFPEKPQTARPGHRNSLPNRASPQKTPQPQKKQPATPKGIPGSVNAKNLEKKRNDYDKPWLEGLKPKTSSKGGRKTDGFLYSVYPDGVGPDDE
jgi:hypothetical protein